MLSPKQAHKIIVSRTSLSVSLQSVYNWIKSGRLPAMPFGGRKVIRPEDLEFFLAEFSKADKQLVGKAE